jgi:hypothetical protein
MMVEDDKNNLVLSDYNKRVFLSLIKWLKITCAWWENLQLSHVKLHH